VLSQAGTSTPVPGAGVHSQIPIVANEAALPDCVLGRNTETRYDEDLLVIWHCSNLTAVPVDWSAFDTSGLVPSGVERLADLAAITAQNCSATENKWQVKIAENVGTAERWYQCKEEVLGDTLYDWREIKPIGFDLESFTPQQVFYGGAGGGFEQTDDLVFVNGELGVGTSSPVTVGHFVNVSSSAAFYTFADVIVEDGPNPVIQLRSDTSKFAGLVHSDPANQVLNAVFFAGSIVYPNGVDLRAGGSNTIVFAINQQGGAIGKESDPVMTFDFSGAVADQFVETVGCRRYRPRSTPPAGVECDEYWDLELKMWCQYNGTNWVQQDDLITICT
jgi:hypothetical protein